MTLKFNFQQLEASIRNEAERASKTAAASMRKQAYKIRDLARGFAPIDQGELRDAIEVLTVRSANTKWRNVYVVYVDPDRVNGDAGKVVGDYAMLVERNMAPYGSGTLNGHGFHASAKSLASGPEVGGRFMRRAVERAAKTMFQEVGADVRKVLGGGNPLVQNRNVLMSERDYGAEQ